MKLVELFRSQIRFKMSKHLYTPIEKINIPGITGLTSDSGSGGFIIEGGDKIMLGLYGLGQEDTKFQLLRVLPIKFCSDIEHRFSIINGGLYKDYFLVKEYYGEKSIFVFYLGDPSNPPIVHEYDSGKNQRISCMCVSPETHKMVCAGNYDGEIYLWPLETREKAEHNMDDRKIIKKPEENTNISAVQFSLNNEYLLVGLNKRSKKEHWLYIMGFNGEILHQLKHQDQIKTIIQCPEHNRLIIGGLTGFIYIWDSKNMKLLFRSKRGETLENLHYDPKTSRIFGRFYHGVVKIWDLKTGKCLQVIPAYEEDYLSNCPMCILPNGELAICINGTPTIFSENEGDNIIVENKYNNLEKVNGTKDDLSDNQKIKNRHRSILSKYFVPEEKGYDWEDFFDECPDALNMVINREFMEGYSPNDETKQKKP